MKWLKEEIEFNRKEFLGISALMSIGLVILVIQFLPQPKEKLYDITIDDILIEKDIKLVADKAPKSKYRKFEPSPYKPKPKIKQKSTPKVFEQFDFNPNTISKDSLVRLGFKKRVAETWVKFRSKGKVFTQQDDVLSIYGIDPNLVQQLTSHFVFASKNEKPKVWEENQEKFYAKALPKPMVNVDLNSCTETDLKKLGGIGQVYASRIIKYRELLGGYVSKDQLLQVYGMSDSTFQVIKEFIHIESPPSLIKVNSASKEQLSDHFLVDYKSAKLIYAYRSQHGPFVDSDDFQAIKGLPEQKKNEIIPYLSFAL